MKLLPLSLVSITLMLLFNACSKPTKGCMDKDAENYSVQAEESDNTCFFAKEKFLGKWNLDGAKYDIHGDTTTIDSLSNFLILKDTSLVNHINVKLLLDGRVDSLPYQPTLYKTFHPITVLREQITIPDVWNQDSTYSYNGTIRYENSQISVLLKRTQKQADTTIYHTFNLTGRLQK